MCGIAGFSLHPDERIDARALARELLHRIEARGRDASGAAWSENGWPWYCKDAVPARRFVADGGLDPMPSDARTVILHTRYATKGHKSIAANNHPIAVPGFVGVHNGHVANDDALISWAGGSRDGHVDSEAIWRTLAAAPTRTEGLSMLRGSAAVAWLETDDPDTLHLARVAGSPLTVLHTTGGSLIFASLGWMAAEAAAAVGLKIDNEWSVPEWLYLPVRDGAIVDFVPFDRHPAPPETPKVPTPPPMRRPLYDPVAPSTRKPPPSPKPKVSARKTTDAASLFDESDFDEYVRYVDRWGLDGLFGPEHFDSWRRRRNRHHRR